MELLFCRRKKHSRKVFKNRYEKNGKERIDRKFTKYNYKKQGDPIKLGYHNLTFIFSEFKH